MLWIHAITFGAIQKQNVKDPHVDEWDNWMISEAASPLSITHVLFMMEHLPMVPFDGHIF